MSKITLKAIFILSLLFSFNQAKAQLSVSYFGNSANSKVGVGYDFNEKLWTELRIYSGTSLENVTAEAVLNYNFLRREKYRTYVGGGVVVNNLNGVVVPIGVQFTPFESLNNFSFHIELQAMYEVDYEDLFINGFGGIRYKFN
ncbi:hypothetical protein [Gillisia limnaea]|uniref:Secreted protein n=1 Tax=Gillisia limnaea (strain DSM 15749 / LMG 21470 / R-8282) TaxID=865937 RepID=H2BXR7_GILLR|nr:hypothetical protein [Gillisia limnaea]EHQ02080.1 hypothetical protein Gilli_1423 [Gillisia limnaea DSM 15749]